jgi:hypothetical protein
MSTQKQTNETPSAAADKSAQSGPVSGGSARVKLVEPAQIGGYRRNIMGTVSFTGKFPGMRKVQEFIVYPLQDAGEVITVQSDNRVGKIDLGTGAGAVCLNRGPGVFIQLADEDRQALRHWVKSTGGVEVGGVVKCDNMGAIAL